jgi:hypothetical protein
VTQLWPATVWSFFQLSGELEGKHQLDAVYPPARKVEVEPRPV